jgi:hypothetical protein
MNICLVLSTFASVHSSLLASNGSFVFLLGFSRIIYHKQHKTEFDVADLILYPPIFLDTRNGAFISKRLKALTIKTIHVYSIIRSLPTLTKA